MGLTKAIGFGEGPKASNSSTSFSESFSGDVAGSSVEKVLSLSNFKCRWSSVSSAEAMRAHRTHHTMSFAVSVRS